MKVSLFRNISKSLLGILFASLLLPTAAFADIADLTVDTGCATLPSYTGVLDLKKGSYDAYVRLAKRGEKAVVSAYTQTSYQDYGSCDKVGRVTASGDAWTKAGVVSVATNQSYTLQLSSTALAAIPDANRPSIMLVPRDGERICQPTVECYVTIGGENAYIRPVGTLLNQDSLHALVVHDPSKDTVRAVRYYVDGTLEYSTSTLQAFDTRYIAYPGQSLTRVIEYDSGQQAIIDTKSPDTFSDSFGNFLFRLTEEYPKTFIALLWLGVGALVSALVLTILRVVRRRHDYLEHHGLIHERKLNIIERMYYSVHAQRRLMFVMRTLVALGFIVVGMGVCIVFTTAYLFSIVTVDGHSMEKTYFTGDQVLVNKIPKTISSLNDREYVPMRGQVIIVRASFGNAVFSADNNTNLTLIKRVIALPNERLVVKNGILTVYNKQYPGGFQPDKGSEWEKRMTPDVKTEDIDIQLGPDEIFVSGDNRPESIDSRFNGPLKTKEIIGVVVGKL